MLKMMMQKTEIQVAIIMVIGVFVTVVGSIKATNLINNGQLEQQRVEAVREMKMKYYNQLTETFAEKLMYTNLPDSIEKVEAEIRFLKEANRVPLYASQEMVQFIENMKNPEIAKSTKTSEYYKIMRKDLSSSDFEDFKNSMSMSISIPNKVIVTGSTGDKEIQECK